VEAKPIQGTGNQPPDLSSLCDAVTEHAPLPMAIAEGAAHIVSYVNPAFCRLIDKPRDQLVGKSFDEMFPEKDECARLLDLVFRTGKPENHTEEERSEPHSIFWSYTMWPVMANERPVGVVIQVTETTRFHERTLAMNEALMLGSVRQHELTEAADLSNVHLQEEIVERKQAEELLRRAQEQLMDRAGQLEGLVTERTSELSATNDQLEAFAYSIAHDLRAPLRHIMGFVAILQNDIGPSLSETSLGHLTKVSQAARRMGKLIDDLLIFSRVGHSKMQKTEVNLDELVQDTLNDFAAETKERKIAWNIHSLPPVQADPALLRMALVNLISNAVKFTGARAEAKIEIGCVPGGEDETVVFIRDNGAGFDPRYASKLFGVFQRLHSLDEFEGTGIGLANVRSIIQRHGGRTWAEGVVDSGATFYFSIPKQNVSAKGQKIENIKS
jgi:signal transduction histidine kinase